MNEFIFTHTEMCERTGKKIQSSLMLKSTQTTPWMCNTLNVQHLECATPWMYNILNVHEYQLPGLIDDGVCMVPH